MMSTLADNPTKSKVALAERKTWMMMDFRSGRWKDKSLTFKWIVLQFDN